MSEEWLYVDLGTGRSAFESRSPRVSGVEEVEAVCCVKVDNFFQSHHSSNSCIYSSSALALWRALLWAVLESGFLGSD